MQPIYLVLYLELVLSRKVCNAMQCKDDQPGTRVITAPLGFIHHYRVET